MTGAEKIGKIAVDLADAAAKADANGDYVHAVFFAVKAAECLTLAKALGAVEAAAKRASMAFDSHYLPAQLNADLDMLQCWDAYERHSPEER